MRHLKFQYFVFFLNSMFNSMAHTDTPLPIITQLNESIDLVDIHTINPHILLDIRYATPNNFTKHKVYASARCFVRKSVALKLNAIQKELETMGLGLKIWDGYRPHSVQKKFWELVPDERYVLNPAKGSNHNRGCAIDLTIVDKNGNELLMPTEFDNFTEKAHHDYMKLDPKAIENRQLLKNIMVKHGFKPIKSEWWHYDDVDSHKYALLDIPIEKLG